MAELRRGKRLAVLASGLLVLQIVASLLVDGNGRLPFLNELQSTLVAFGIFGGFFPVAVILVVLDRRWWLLAVVGIVVTLFFGVVPAFLPDLF